MCIWHCLYCLKSGLLDRCFNCRAINTASKGKTGLRLEFMLFYLFWYLWNLLHFVSFFQVAPWGNQSGGNKWFHIGERDYSDRIYALTHSNDMNVFLLCFVFCFLNCTSFLFFFFHLDYFFRNYTPNYFCRGIFLLQWFHWPLCLNRHLN